MSHYTILREPGMAAVVAQTRLLRPTETYSPHFHEGIEWELVLCGEGEHLYNGLRYPVHRGDGYLMGAYDFHAFTACTEVRLLHLSFGAERLEPSLSSALLAGGDHRFSLGEDEIAQSEAQLTELLREMERADAYSASVVQAILTRLTVSALRRAGAAPAPSSSVRRAVTYLEQHFREPITVASAAAALGYSTNYFGRSFTANCGLSFTQALTRARLRYATRLLACSDKTARAIGEEAGFSSAEYFFYVFHRSLGLTPEAYRREVRRHGWGIEPLPTADES